MATNLPLSLSLSFSIQYLDTLRISKKAGSNSPTGDRERCPKHKEKMTVYCESCKKCICHMCALFGGEHNEHKFKPLDELYRGVKEKLNSEV
jgi:tripartite motif-containing protein 37